MSDELSSIIAAVRNNEYSFYKFISPNDAGTTGAHQAGLYIPKNSRSLIFDTPGIRGENKERFANITWFDGSTSSCCFKYYGVGTRNEYRITRLGRYFAENDLIVIVKLSEEEYEGYVLIDEVEIELFLRTFELKKEDTNGLIVHHKEYEHWVPENEVELIALDENLPYSNILETKNVNFKPKAHILTLLGEELIKDPVMAIYELVKNSYDADAKDVDVYFNNIGDLEDSSIIVKDSGLGMSEDVLENVWLEPGTAFRKPLDKNGKRQIVRSPIYERVPMGEKGVGRFAVHKLGNVIKLISRPSRIILDEHGKFLRKELLNYEIKVEIDWRSFTQSKYLSDVKIEYTKNTDIESFYFKEDSGTYIRISSLKEIWNRGMARQLKRHTVSMVSPKNDPQKFIINLNFNNNWLDRFPDVNELLSQAPYKLTAILDRNYNLTFEYEFRLANNSAVGAHILKNDKNYDKNIIGSLRPLFRKYYEEKGYEVDVIETLLDSKSLEPIPFGEIMMELYSYDLDSTSLKDITYTPDILKKVLRDQYGIKVFKGDLRVYDYGEPGNDWLKLDIKRVNNKEWFSNNQNIGFIYLDSETSGSLVEKTNREGFIKNESYDYFEIVIEYILIQFRIERQKDRLKWTRFNKKDTGISFSNRVSNFVALINDAEIDDESKKQRLLEEASKIESDYEKAQETLLIPAGVGMTASVALHEIEKLVPRMQETVELKPIDHIRVRNQVEELDDYVSGILSVLKQAGNKPVDVESAINQALSNYRLKLKIRKIAVVIDVSECVTTIQCDKRYLVTMLMNLIDNSIYWLDTIYKEDKAILVKAFKVDNVSHIIIADNGPGFKDSVEEIVTPFFSRKDGGIGIGMYLIDTIMMKYGKLKIFTENGQADVDENFNGAIVELVFNKNQED
ncbi:EcoRII N-terminal effector-binding domain-containing protein [Pedobacter nutrimenti]|uniref:Histidine kinase/DNA gyrase B/HSP90-like ATPase n=1 Tax=Pedobacter nutrimenti TaxID=1241337 RepID=A0A318UFT5_9SPHI|nr:EcoRII N-terminal effector-binding domain-containing protein [Pedobacter nutrimenti]PYF74350.1 histidine kinase/DNA gyrase B/HSP90-like ATPase [Pedobacter nutrimenti]